MSKKRLLFIDDEEINRINFLHTFSDEYLVEVAGSGAEGLTALAAEEYAVVLSDQRMPGGMSGVDLLVRAARVAPRSERIIVTAYTEPDDIIDAINQGHVYRYIVKPWDEAEFRGVIRQAVERYELRKNNEELLQELQRKNDELLSLNADLDSRIRERTREIDRANAQLIEKNRDLETANAKITKQADQLFETNDRLVARIKELERARQEVKDLKGLLPICSYCKKIRDDKDYWHEVEAYLHEHNEMIFTHGVCPACYEKVLASQLAALKKK